MSQYMHLRCGDIECLLDIDCVQEVDAISAPQDSHGLRLWRGQPIPVTDLSKLFSQTSRPEQQIVIKEGTSQAMLDVEQILGLMTIPDQHWQNLTPITKESAHHFDQVFLDDEGKCLLRLRRPLTWLHK